MVSKANKCSDFIKKVGVGWLAVLQIYDIMREQRQEKQLLRSCGVRNDRLPRYARNDNQKKKE